MKKILLSFFVILNLHVDYLFANSDILNDNIQQDFELKNEQINKSSDSLSNSWIDPVIISIQKNRNKNGSNIGKEDFMGFSVDLNQDIFRSGGIFYAIKYADATRVLGLKNIQKLRQTQVITAYSLFLKLLKNDKMQLQKRLNIQNAKLNIKRKNEQYLSGLIDITSLNDAILEKIANENALLSLQDTKNTLLLSFQKLSKKEYQNIKLLHVKVPSKDEYIAQNITLSIKQSENQNQKYLSKLTKSKYLPKLTLNASYHANKLDSQRGDVKEDFYNYGIKFSMPLSVNSFDEIESSRLKYLISKNQEQIEKHNQSVKYEKIKNDLKNIDKKINLAKKNLKIYQTLLTQTKELVKANIKIEDDLTIMKNSKNIREVQLQIHNLEKEEKMLEFYEDFTDSNFKILSYAHN